MSERIPESQGCRKCEQGQVFEAIVYNRVSTKFFVALTVTARRTHAKQAGKDQSCEQQDEADGKLLVLRDGGCEGLARRGVPKALERSGRH